MPLSLQQQLRLQQHRIRIWRQLRLPFPPTGVLGDYGQVALSPVTMAFSRVNDSVRTYLAMGPHQKTNCATPTTAKVQLPMTIHVCSKPKLALSIVAFVKGTVSIHSLH